MEDETTSGENTMDIYEPVIVELLGQIEEWQKMIVNLRMMQSKGSPSAPSSSGMAQAAHQHSSVSFSNDAFFGMTIADGAKKFLAATKKTATARSITDALLAGGMKSAAKSPTENVRSILSRHSYFVMVNGEFGLAEWYPGRKGSAKQRGSAASQVAEETPHPESEIVDIKEEIDGE